MTCRGARLLDALRSAVATAWAAELNSLAASVRTAETEGDLLMRGLIDQVGDQTWQHGLDSLAPAYRSPDVRRILGLGYALSSYLIEPIPIPDQRRARIVAELGALANFIVSLFDHCVDTVAEAQDWLCPADLRSLLAAADAAGMPADVPRAPAEALLIALVQRYQQHAAQLATEEPPQQKDIAALTTTIIAMRQAHAHAVAGASASTLRDKSALPFVVMASPGWIGVTDRSRRQQHLDWVYEVGEFFGWLDDAVDYDIDRAAGQPNLLGDLDPATKDFEGVLAERIVGAADQLDDSWLRLVRATGEDTDSWTRHSLRLATVSWLGGVDALAGQGLIKGTTTGEAPWHSGQAS
jgi:hypothetical protein